MHRLPALTLCLFAWLAAVPLRAAADPALLGCWRAQHSDYHLADGKLRRMNSDCVYEIDARNIRGECRMSNGPFNSLASYEVPAPGRYLSTPISPAPATPEAAAPREVKYAADGEWLVLTVRPPRAPQASAPPPDRIESLLVRVPAGGRCAPLGPSPVRASPGPSSSLVLGLPAGFAPVLEDPYKTPALAALINTNFLIGHFVPGGAQPAAGLRAVLVIEDTRQGARPVKADDFARFKEQLKREMGGTKVACESATSLCFSVADAASTTVTQFVNVKGRVAMVFSVAPGRDAQADRAALRASDVFAARLLADNP